MLAEKIYRFPDAGVAKLNLRNNDAVELVCDPRRAAGVAGERIADRADGLAILANRFFPPFLHLPELARTRLVIGP